MRLRYAVILFSVASLTVVLAEGTPLGAQPHSTAFQPSSISEAVAEGPVHRLAPSIKSERRARLVSLGATVGGFALGRAMLSSDGATADIGTILVVTSIFVGPGAGSIYADDWRRARQGVFLRTSCLAAGLLLPNSDNFENPLVPAALFAIPVSILHDITIASVQSTREYNRRYADSPSVSVAPWFGDGAGGLGAQVAVRW